MKILWVSSSNTFYNHTDAGSSNSSYNGVGWVGAQQLEIMKYKDIELAIMFMSNRNTDTKKVIDGVSYYPIIDSPGILKRIKRFYIPSKKSVYDRVSNQVKDALADFNPDLIHIFGLECPLCEIIEQGSIPTIVHLQGILNPITCSYLSPGFSKESLKKYGCWWREYIFNNGFGFYYQGIIRRCKREEHLYSLLKHCTGRTHWDKSVTMLYAPDCKYYHIDEILRPEFYTEHRIEPRKEIPTLRIMSTISETVYKGLDLIVKTARLLDKLHIDYEWHIVGIKSGSNYVKLIDRTLGFSHSDHLCFEGVKNPQEMIELFYNTDVYVHPSYIDNSPNSVCEAQILGIPVIATNTGGVSSLIEHRISGILVPTNEPHMLVSCLAEIRQCYELRNMLSANGRNVALKRHDKSNIINKVVGLYQNLVNAKA